MKVIIFALVIMASSFANDHHMPLCDSMAANVVSCYELGHLASSYDETGLECGTQGDSVWLVEASVNDTITARVEEARSYGYMGGHATDSTCYVTFKNEKNNICSFELTTSIGSEDGSIDITEFRCSY